MKRNFLYSLLSLLISVTAQAQGERKVAVFDPAGSVDTTLLDVVREEISSAVVNTRGYTVLERQLINKVLEENKFQASGLVNDEQVSDIGRRMGADYVVVSTISTLGSNYYISCKMIEVATARIDRQFTGTTTSGISDLPQTTQYVVKRMFGENVRQQATNKQREQPDESKQIVVPASRQVETTNREPAYYGVLTANGMNVYSFGHALPRNNVKSLMANTDALKYYNSGIKKRKTGNILTTIGWVLFGVGTVADLSMAASDESYEAGGGIALSAIGFCAFAIPGYILKSSAKKNIRKAVNIYNSGSYGYSEPPAALEFNFGITSSGGIGLVMTF